MRDDYKYTVGFTPQKLTKEDMKRGKTIAKFHKQAATDNALLEDKMYYLILNEKPKHLAHKDWVEMVKTVVRIEIVQEYPKLFSFGDDL